MEKRDSAVAVNKKESMSSLVLYGIVNAVILCYLFYKVFTHEQVIKDMGLVTLALMYKIKEHFKEGDENEREE